MFKNKEETRLLSDDEFERVGRRKKILIFIIPLMVILIATILTFKFILKDSDKDINVAQPEVSSTKVVEEETVDETASKKNITEDMMMEGESKAKLLPDIRNTEAGENEFICEYKDIILPELLKTGDYADVRLSLADGRNYTVVSDKKIMDFNKSEDKSLLYLALCEEEIIILDSAISDIKLFDGAKLYLVIGKQQPANKVNYPVNKKADKLLHSEKIVNNLSGYDYEVEFDKELEKERLALSKALYYKGQEWKEAASYWNDKE